MALKAYKPSSPARRGLVMTDRAELWKGQPVKHLTRGLSASGGRNHKGRITARHRGGRHKRVFREIDFKRRNFDVPAQVERIEYDPNRSAHIALIKYETGELAYILAPQRLRAGDLVVSGLTVDVKPGNAMPLEHMPIGTIIHNIEMKPGKGGQLARSAGAYAQLVGRDGDYAIIRLKSRRAAPHSYEMHGQHWRGLQSGSWQSEIGQGRAQSLARISPACARRGDEPGRSSAWRRRGQIIGRAPSGLALGAADQGQAHAIQ